MSLAVVFSHYDSTQAAWGMVVIFLIIAFFALVLAFWEPYSASGFFILSFYFLVIASLEDGGVGLLGFVLLVLAMLIWVPMFIKRVRSMRAKRMTALRNRYRNR